MRCAAASTRLGEFRHVLKGTAAGGGTELGPLTGAILDKEGAFIISPSLLKKTEYKLTLHLHRCEALERGAAGMGKRDEDSLNFIA